MVALVEEHVVALVGGVALVAAHEVDSAAVDAVLAAVVFRERNAAVDLVVGAALAAVVLVAAHEVDSAAVALAVAHEAD